jgi:hypothetical protein
MHPKPLKIGIAFLSLCVAVGCTSPPEIPDEVILYSIDGRDFEEGQKPKTDEQFYGRPVLGKVALTDAKERREVWTALEAGMARPDSVETCFWPRHGVRVTQGAKQVDYVVCFECKQVLIREGTSANMKAISESPQVVLDKYLTRAGIKLAPKPFR